MGRWPLHSRLQHHPVFRRNLPMHAYRFELGRWQASLLHQCGRRSDHYRRLQCGNRLRHSDHAHALVIQTTKALETEAANHVHVYVGRLVS